MRSWQGEAEPVMYSSPELDNEGVVALEKGWLAALASEKGEPEPLTQTLK